MRTCPDCGVDIPALNIRCDPCHWKWYGAHVGGQAPTAQPASVPEADATDRLPRLGVEHQPWCDSPLCGGCTGWKPVLPDPGLPPTAQRILDLGRTQQVVELVQPVNLKAAGIARAVANLNDHEKRLGASRFQP
jgi:hypothetical protein